MSNIIEKDNYPVIGKLALKHSLVEKQDIEKAMAACADSIDRDKAFEEYLVSRELISSLNMKRLKTAAKVMEMRQKDIRFGAIAVNMKFVTKNLIQMALDEQKQAITQKKRAKRIGEILVDAGIISSTQKELILREQHRLQKEKNRIIRNASQQMDDQKKRFKDVHKQTEKESEQSGTKSVILGQKQKKQEINVEPVIRKNFPEGIKLVIQKDGLAAYLSKTNGFNENIKVNDVLEILKKERISFGIVDETLIKGFIKSNAFLKKPFKIAAGIAPVPGKDARIKYLFDTNRLKPGKINENGEIDFKERGEIPYVQEGVILAEKIPMVKEKPGKNIFGDIITIPSAKDVKIKYDRGAKLSDNAAKVVATMKGQPTLSWSGVISVLDDFVTRTDVNYETGHIDYHGNIRIKGCVQNGLKVKGYNIWANEIDGGIINAEGDLRVAGIIRNARIYSRGNIWAKFIQKSEILCMGDIHSTKEIVESNIKNSGACIIERGKIISSDITSKMGVYARDIGTEMSSPSHITTGVDSFIPGEIEKLEEKISAVEIKIANCEGKIAKFEEDNRKHQDEITKLAQIQDRAEIEQKTIAEKISSLDETIEFEEIGKFRSRLNALKKAAVNAEKQLNICFNRTYTQNKKIARLNISVALNKDRLQDLITEKENLIAWGEKTPGIAIVRVTGTIMPRTVVTGKHSEKKIRIDVKNATIKEVVVAQSKSGNKEAVKWEIQIIPR